MLIRGHLRCPSLSRFARSIVTGRATPAATEAFLKSASLSLFCKFDKSQLSSNPVIHGSLINWQKKKTNNAYVNLLARKAVESKVNALVVYEHGGPDLHYAVTGLKDIFALKKGIKREEMIAIANLGAITDSKDVAGRLAAACKAADLETIDMAFIEVNDQVLAANEDLSDVLGALEDLCAAGTLQSFGVRSSIAPYNQHKPIVSETGKWLVYNGALEELSKAMKYMDMVVYPVSPSIGLPSTYPLLDGPHDVREMELGPDGKPLVDFSSEFENAAEGEGDEEDDEDLLDEDDGDLDEDDDEDLDEEGEDEVNNEDEDEDEDDDEDEEDDEDEDDDDEEENHEDEDDEDDDEEENHEDEDEDDEDDDEEDDRDSLESIETLEGDEDGEGSEDNDEEDDLSLSDDDEDEDMVMETPRAPRLLTRVASDPMICYHNVDAIVMDEKASMESQMEAVEARQNALIPWLMFSGVNDADDEKDMAQALVGLCPKLSNSPTLQEKALRIALSVEMDMVLVDAELSAVLGKFPLTTDKLLTHQDTTEIFKRFVIPR